jgi:hypothetical protein
MKKFFNTKKAIIKEFAKEIATLQMKADKWYYVHENQDMSSFVLNKVDAIKSMCTRLGICNEVYQEAYKIYDFRNSGKNDFVPNMELLKSI